MILRESHSAVNELIKKLPSLSKHDYGAIDQLVKDVAYRHKISIKALHKLFHGHYKTTPNDWVAKNKLTEDRSIDLILEVKKCATWAKEKLKIKILPKIKLSYDTEEAQNNHHTGGHTLGDNTIWVYAKNRNLVDILRTILHELVHVRQEQDGKIKPGDSYPGSPIEVEADAVAGVLIKQWGAMNHHIFEGYKEVTQKYITSGADPSKVKTAIDQYRELVNRNQVAGDERNIDWWGKNKSFNEFSNFISSKDLNRTKTQLKRNKVQGEVITLRDDDEWTIVIPLDKDASCNYGSNTDWCTAKRERDYYEDYVAKGVVLIYCINNQTKKKWAIATSFVVKNSSEFFDQHDTSLTSQQFATQTGLNPTQLISQASKYNTQIEKARQNVKYKDKLTNPKTAYEYAENVIKGRWTEGEAVIASNPKYAYYYAKNVIKGRWHEGEAVIASDPKYAYFYAINVIVGRWHEGEAVIASDPKYAYLYVMNVIKGIWPEGEAVISRDANYALYYATDIIKGRFPEGEAAIASDPYYAKEYANFLKNKKKTSYFSVLSSFLDLK